MSLYQRVTAAVLSRIWHYSSIARNTSNQSPSPRPLLRRFPFWAKGHELLAEESLQHDKVACAYGSALCMIALRPDDPRTMAQANFILGRCYLRRGDWTTAHHHLQEALRLSPSNAAIREEDAAALILGGELRQAREILEQIPEGSLSVEGKAARAFLRSKVEIQ
jgi:tetratricopeptide (TPR) repeat protein